MTRPGPGEPAVPRVLAGRLWERTTADADFLNVRRAHRHPGAGGAARPAGHQAAGGPRPAVRRRAAPVRARLLQRAQAAGIGAAALVHQHLRRGRRRHRPGPDPGADRPGGLSRIHRTTCGSASARAGRIGDWEWVKWLPQAQHPAPRDGMGPIRLLFPSLELLEQAFDRSGRARPFTRHAELPQGLRHLVVVIDDGYVTGDERLASGSGLDSVTVLDLTGPDGHGAGRALQLVLEPETRSAHQGGCGTIRDTDRMGMARGSGHGPPAEPLPLGECRADCQRGARLARRRP